MNDVRVFAIHLLHVTEHIFFGDDAKKTTAHEIHNLSKIRPKK